MGPEGRKMGNSAGKSKEGGCTGCQGWVDEACSPVEWRTELINMEISLSGGEDHQEDGECNRR